MKRLTYTRPHLLAALHDELIAAGLPPLRCEGGYPDRPDAIALEYDDAADEAAVAAVVAAHDGAAAQSAYDAARQAERDEDTQVTGFVAQLDDAIATAQAAGTLTAAQVKAGLLLALKGVRLIIRYELRRRGT